MNKTDFVDIDTEKGFRKISFNDDYKQKCSLQKSNTSIKDKICFGVDKDINGNMVNARMHLTQEQVKELLPYLLKFTDTGNLF